MCVYADVFSHLCSVAWPTVVPGVVRCLRCSFGQIVVVVVVVVVACYWAHHSTPWACGCHGPHYTGPCGLLYRGPGFLPCFGAAFRTAGNVNIFEAKFFGRVNIFSGWASEYSGFETYFEFKARFITFSNKNSIFWSVIIIFLSFFHDL